MELQQAAAADPFMQALSSIIQHAWPKSKDVPNALRQYWDYRDELHSVDDLLFRAQRVFFLTVGKRNARPHP